MVPAPVLGAHVAQGSGAAEWSELDQQHIDNYHNAQAAAASSAAPVPVQDANGQWYLPDPRIQYVQPPGGAFVANNIGVSEQHPGKQQELVVGERAQPAAEDLFANDE